ncbi:N-acetyltransferase family protein [Parapedomonas caeni]
MTEPLIRPVTARDHAQWLPLWHGYCRFYRCELPEPVTAFTWARLVAGDGLHGLVAERDGRLVGLVNYLFHPSTWSLHSYCYLEDLFVDPDVRGGGIGRRLIAGVYAAADAAGAERVYWLTEESNATAQALYDRIGRRAGFIQYRRP